MEQLTIPMSLDGYTRHQRYYCNGCDTHPADNGGDSPLFFRDDCVESYGSNGLAMGIHPQAHRDPDAVYCEVCGTDAEVY